MPTYQSAPLYPPVFPSLVRNHYGFQPLKGNTLAYADLPAPGPGSHPSWKKDAEFSVMARLENNRIKELEMMRGPPSIKGHIPSTTRRGPGGHAISGGTVWNADAEKTIQNLLRDRKFQLDAIDQSNFDSVSPERLRAPETVVDTFALDQLFSNLLSSLDEGLINKTLLSYTSSIITFFLTKADKISDHKFAEYSGILNQISTIVNDLFYKDVEGVYAEELTKSELGNLKRVLKKLEHDVDGLMEFIHEYMGYLGEPTKSKSARLSAIRNKLLTLARSNASSRVEGAEETQRQYEQGERFAPDEELGSEFDYEPPAPAPAPIQQGLAQYGFVPAPVGQGLHRRWY